MTSTPHPTDGSSTHDVAHAVAFIENQATCLVQGLQHASSPLLVRSVLDQHDASHPEWLTLIAWAGTADLELRDLLADLYAQHGRSAGALEAADRPLLPPHVRARVLALHERDLTARTAAAQTALLALGGPAS